MYRFKTLAAAVAIAAARWSLRLNPALRSLSRTYASRYAAKKGKIGDGANVRKVLPPHLQSDNVAKLTCESSASGGICDVYLVGTCHGTPESKREVENLIHFLEPESAGKDKLEVALKRVGEKKGYTLTISGFEPDWNPAYGPDDVYDAADCEFVAAFLLAIIYDIKVIPGDRPTEIKSKLMENYDEVMVDERDQYMSAKLLEAARQHSSVVAVVGRAHLEGIQKNWKQPVELEQLLVIPRDPWIVVCCVLVAGKVCFSRTFFHDYITSVENCIS